MGQKVQQQLTIPVPRPLNLFLVGVTGTGKSTFTNTVIPGAHAKTSGGIDGCTQELQKWSNGNLTVTDTPGDQDPKHAEEYWKNLMFAGINNERFDVVVFLIKGNKAKVKKEDCTLNFIIQILNKAEGVDLNSIFYVFTDPPTGATTQAAQDSANASVLKIFEFCGMTHKIGDYNPNQHCSVWDIKSEFEGSHPFHINETIRKLNAFAGKSLVGIRNVSDPGQMAAAKDSVFNDCKDIVVGVKEQVEKTAERIERAQREGKEGK